MSEKLVTCEIGAYLQGWGKYVRLEQDLLGTYWWHIEANFNRRNFNFLWFHAEQ